MQQSNLRKGRSHQLACQDGVLTQEYGVDTTIGDDSETTLHDSFGMSLLISTNSTLLNDMRLTFFCTMLLSARTSTMRTSIICSDKRTACRCASALCSVVRRDDLC